MRLETEDIGELGIVVEIVDKKVWYVFHTPSGETRHLIGELTPWLRDRMLAQNFTLVGVQTVPKRLDVKRMLLPTVNLNTISRVQTEV